MISIVSLYATGINYHDYPKSERWGRGGGTTQWMARDREPPLIKMQKFIGGGGTTQWMTRDREHLLIKIHPPTLTATPVATLFFKHFLVIGQLLVLSRTRNFHELLHLRREHNTNVPET
jgi:hypothetical protein